MHQYTIIEKGSPVDKAGRALILLHGRGGSAEDILSLAGHFTDESWYVVAPQATGNSWYPHSFLMPAEQNEPWLSSAIDTVNRLLLSVLKHISSENIFIMGFSQGACLSAEVAARFARKYGGIAAFTGGLIGDYVDNQKYRGNFEGTKIYLSNGSNDPHIPLERSEKTKITLEKQGAHVKLDIFQDRQHTVLMEEVERARGFLLTDLNNIF